MIGEQSLTTVQFIIHSALPACLSWCRQQSRKHKQTSPLSLQYCLMNQMILHTACYFCHIADSDRHQQATFHNALNPHQTVILFHYQHHTNISAQAIHSQQPHPPSAETQGQTLGNLILCGDFPLVYITTLHFAFKILMNTLFSPLVYIC